ncbi:hypothetical protein [Georgenia alba]|uniref:Uncharacterized protein n=1 Tax=Georgenia alba TaxID=2233858 RepID=A0ABW2Q8I8_9MICO
MTASNENHEEHRHQIDEMNSARYAELQQRWHGWGSPVGLGLGVLCLGLAVSSIIAAIGVVTAAGALFNS